MFGHGIAGADSALVRRRLSRTTARGAARPSLRACSTSPRGSRCRSRLGTDWNALLRGPGPRFGPRAADGLEGEIGARRDLGGRPCGPSG